MIEVVMIMTDGRIKTVNSIVIAMEVTAIIVVIMIIIIMMITVLVVPDVLAVKILMVTTSTMHK